MASDNAMPKDQKKDLPGTIQRSPAKAQRIFRKPTLESAHEQYDSEERAHRTAFSAVKHSFEKVGDHWEPKRGGRKGPSDERAARGRSGGGRSAGGVDVMGHTRQELYERAKSLGVTGRSSMSKQQLGEAIARKQD